MFDRFGEFACYVAAQIIMAVIGALLLITTLTVLVLITNLINGTW